MYFFNAMETLMGWCRSIFGLNRPTLSSSKVWSEDHFMPESHQNMRIECWMVSKQPSNVILGTGNDFRKCGFQMIFSKNLHFSVHHNVGFVVTEIFVRCNGVFFSYL